VRPDLKDCEYVLGYFCQTMIQANQYVFTRNHFLNTIQSFCKDQVIDLDVEVVFDVLNQNSIIIARGNEFCFRFSYWIFYFTAQRMHQDPIFASYILENKRYASFPEIIEFYTGIDRRREDALNVLLKDISSIIDVVDQKIGFPKEMNPYQFAQWNPTKDSLEKVQNLLSESVKESLLPESIKDQYADRTYDKSRPYHQEIQNIIEDYSLATLFNITTAAARALRNSDYVKPTIKRKLMDLIMQSLEQLSIVLIAVAPVLAIDGEITYEGTNIVLVGTFGDTLENKINNVLSCIPANIIATFQSDLYSKKMGSLLIDRLSNESTDLIRHYLILLLITQRPNDWKIQTQNYISCISKNSYYLADLHRALLSQYLYSYISQKTLEEIKYLIKMILVKHEFGVKQPGIKAINKISDKQLPERFVN
jgi:hypothetical protein